MAELGHLQPTGAGSTTVRHAPIPAVRNGTASLDPFRGTFAADSPSSRITGAHLLIAARRIPSSQA